eukprot:6209429-Pleurochrysis_carterae.AAC.2
MPQQGLPCRGQGGVRVREGVQDHALHFGAPAHVPPRCGGSSARKCSWRRRGGDDGAGAGQTHTEALEPNAYRGARAKDARSSWRH